MEYFATSRYMNLILRDSVFPLDLQTSGGEYFSLYLLISLLPCVFFINVSAVPSVEIFAYFNKYFIFMFFRGGCRIKIEIRFIYLVPLLNERYRNI